MFHSKLLRRIPLYAPLHSTVRCMKVDCGSSSASFCRSFHDQSRDCPPTRIDSPTFPMPMLPTTLAFPTALFPLPTPAPPSTLSPTPRQSVLVDVHPYQEFWDAIRKLKYDDEKDDHIVLPDGVVWPLYPHHTALVIRKCDKEIFRMIVDAWRTKRMSNHIVKGTCNTIHFL